MGSGGWSANTWASYAQQNVQGKTQQQVFTARGLNEDVDPRKFKNHIRESVDSDDNPNSTPVAIFTDATGSMGHLAGVVVRKLDVVAQELLDRKAVPDVHIMTGIVGDGYTDPAPIQATQFEADIRIAQQTQKLWLNGCSGGSNGGESYALPWLVMSQMTVTDSFDKRGKKGYVFTVGDEGIHGCEGSRYHKMAVTVEQAERLLDIRIEKDLTAQEVLDMVSRRFHVFHIVVGTGHQRDIDDTWVPLMGERLLYLEGNNVDLLPELIVSTIEVNEGRDVQSVAQSWGDGKAVVLANSLKGLQTRAEADDEVVAL